MSERKPYSVPAARLAEIKDRRNLGMSREDHNAWMAAKRAEINAMFAKEGK